MSDKAQKKRLEREARKAQQKQQKQEADVNILQPAVAEPSNAAPAQQTHTVHVPGSSDDLPWYEPQAYYTIDEARTAGIWEYPRDVKERAECAVFRDLWEKGNYLGPGIKFGGNYLVYPGQGVSLLPPCCPCSYRYPNNVQVTRCGSTPTLSRRSTHRRRHSSAPWTSSPSDVWEQRLKRFTSCVGTTTPQASSHISQ